MLGGDWLEVDGNGALGTSDFCVMKYEAKCSDQLLGENCNLATNTTISQATNTPWVSIDQIDARTACSNLGSGYKLFTDPECVTIPRIAELDSTNWDSGTVYSGVMYIGIVNLSDALSCGSNSVLDGDTNGTKCLIGNINKRTLNISGDLIWDLSGNVWERTNDTFNSNSESALGQGSDGFKEWNIIGSSWDYLKPFNTSLTSTNGIGQVYVYNNTIFPSGTIHAFLRGGYWYDGAYTGAFALSLNRGPSSPVSTYNGFRVRIQNIFFEYNSFIFQ